MKEILFILPEFFPETAGGICSYYTGLLAKLKATSNWNITVIQGSAFDMPGGKNSWNEIPIYHLSTSLFNKQKEKFRHFNLMPEFQNHLVSAWAMYDLAQSLSTDFDAVITTDWGLGFIPWIIENKIPTIIHLHGSIGQIDHYDYRVGMEFWSDLYLNTEISLFNHASAIATYSRQNINFWTERLISKEKFSLILPIIENNYQEQDNEKSNFFTGLVLGRIQYWKGVIQLCEAITLLDEKERSKLRIYWIGRDTFYYDAGLSMDAFLSKKFPNIWKKIILPIGSKSHEEIEDFYKKIDFTLVPSTWDMFNITAVEHLLHKKPLICSTGAGASDFLSQSKDIFIFNNTAEDLADKLSTIMNVPEKKLVEIGHSGFSFSKELFNTDNSVNQHINLINKTIETFNTQENLDQKFSWLVPKAIKSSDRAKEVLIQSWPLKEVIYFVVKAIKKKMSTYLSSIWKAAFKNK